jgi:hypothetical protein
LRNCSTNSVALIDSNLAVEHLFASP